MNDFSNQANKIDNVEVDCLVSFVAENLDVLVVLKEDHQSSSVFWEERDRSDPDKVIGGPYVAVDFGDYYLLALGEDGKLRDRDNHGTKQLYPDKTFTSITTRYGYSAALQDCGKIKSWGRNIYGQPNVNDETYTSIAIGYSHIVTIRGDGTLAAWGNCFAGHKDVPDGIYTEVAAGSEHSLALGADGTLKAWGRNEYGQTDVPDGTYTTIAAKLDCSLALRDDNELVIFGDHRHDIKDSHLSKNIPFIANGSHHTFIIKPDGEFFVVGNRRPNPNLDQSLDSNSIFNDETIDLY